MIRVITWNVNSIRKRIEQLCGLLSEYNVDVALLQEIKCTNDQFPMDELKAMGYECCINGQKSRNGVAILSRIPVLKVESYNLFYGIENERSAGSYSHEESRYIECSLDFQGINVRVISVYVPNGMEVETDTFDYKLYFLECLKHRLLDITSSHDYLVVGGDFNVAPENIDVHDPKHMDGRLCFHIDERNKFRELTNGVLIDAYRTYVGEEKQEFSWWNYREGAWQNNRGMRIDGILLSPQMSDMMQGCSIVSKIRGVESPSDHAFVMCDLSTTNDIILK